MAIPRLPFALLLLLPAAALSGCSNSGATSLASVFEHEETEEGVLLLEGDIISVSLDGTNWNGTASRFDELDAIAGPRMGSPEPAGGGADATDIPYAVNATLSLRAAQADELNGYTAYWIVHPAGMDLNASMEGAMVRTASADETATVELPAPGTYAVALALDRSGDLDLMANGTLPEGVAMSLGIVQWGVHIPFSGEVQPVRASTPAGSQGATSAADMRDTFRFAVGPWTPVTVMTRYDGAITDGTDVDVGFHDPADTPYLCTGTGANTLPATAPYLPDPGQAMELLAAALPEAGTWSLVVGAMEDTCPMEVGGPPTAGWYYHNAGPVPYAGDLWIGAMPAM